MILDDALREKVEKYKLLGYKVPQWKYVKTPEQIEGIRKAPGFWTMSLPRSVPVFPHRTLMTGLWNTPLLMAAFVLHTTMKVIQNMYVYQ